ncbi:MAG: YggS family pyridoxal phosphate-dependent enzyme [Deltaproteobacteria bacterium]|nr:MAG: YggS family pyridoxal phosphate-dependent enzyme [Deltaproteobacteria bacterium]
MNVSTNTYQRPLTRVIQRIGDAAGKAGRDPSDIRLVAVSKTVAADRLRQAVLAGVETVGENYIQEARNKFSELGDLPVQWHFIGHLQRNKAKYAVRIFDLIHSVDSVRLADEINHQAERINKTQPILVQVNLAGEPTKSGVAPEAVEQLVRHIGTLPCLSLQGLMTMPPFFNAPEKVRPYFKQLRLLRDRMRKLDIPNIDMNELSMGMTGDFETAVEEGATLVRIGTAIFGARK